ncbi:sodium/proton antiporter NhaB [Kordiimonas sp. SCSIO 12603]|uniref:sodium/proton antiporter NhaB n=1 Tax=Kordiimonas sp. SCSIO 12603 TaxID=2829596 RepID=UPI0021078ADC|nr:sodium/proton antiporter NhaB [Kordiimonas sp. SCSIO 12603]UTW57734.1 sodium/proton antiporter NhaB [Kordiimonas sp. SCSIO 12603]
MSLFANPAGRNFLGNSAEWYKMAILGFLILNPILYYTAGAYVAGWALVLEFIFTLAMALKCYPLQPGGLLAIEAVALGMTSPGTVVHEIESNLEVIMLLVFMVAGIYFLKNMLLFVFTKILVNVRNKVILSMIFSFMAAILSAFLDALTVTAVVISISVGFYSIYHKVASGKDFGHDHNHSDDGQLDKLNENELEQFRAFLRSLMMHAAVGTALGGVMTLVGEPQNILIGARAGWAFDEFFFRMVPVTLPVFFAGLATCVVLELTGKFGYGAKIPEKVLNIIVDYDNYEGERRTKRDKAALMVQGIVALWLVVALIIHISPGLVGLSVIVLASALTGITEEHQIGHAFEEALPFTALLVVFFSIVGVISDNQLFAPVTEFVLSLPTASEQITALFIANGVLSAISDNVFVATVYVTETTKALADGVIDRDTFDLMAVAINTGTNIPSVATPNGQAAFLFLLTSALAPLIRLSYMKMVIMALPYTIVMSIVGYIAVANFLQPITQDLYDAHLIEHHSATVDTTSKGGH